MARGKHSVLFRALERLDAAYCVNLRKLAPVAPRLKSLKANDNPILDTLSVSTGTKSKQPSLVLRYLNLSNSTAVPEADISQLLAAANQLTHLLFKDSPNYKVAPSLEEFVA